MAKTGRRERSRPPRANARTPREGSKLKSTDISNPDYFHKVVDCQWACPAHTPVPEYIRLIAAGRYADAYMVNWESNVFPGILGRTCDRPCEPACRRGRVEEEPVAICRLKRVAADYKGDVSARMPRPAESRNGKRIALRRSRSRLLDGGPRSRAGRVRRRGLQFATERWWLHPKPDPQIPFAGKRDRRGGRLYHRPRRRDPVRPAGG